VKNCSTENPAWVMQKAEASDYGVRTIRRSHMANPLTLFFFPVVAILLLKIARQKRR